MNPRQFLLLGGIILVVLALLGVVGFGPTPTDSVLGESFWLDSGENIAHLVLGVVALLAYFFLKDDALARMLVILVGIIALLATVLGFLNASNESGANFYGLTNLENPFDNVLHLVVAVWAFWVSFMGKKTSSV